MALTVSAAGGPGQSLPDIGEVHKLTPAQEDDAFRRNVSADDAAMNDVFGRIYKDCFAGRLRDPSPPCLPYCFFAPGGGYPDCQAVWDEMFVLNFYAPWGQRPVMRGGFENYWNAIDHNPKAPKGSFRYGMVPCSLLATRKEHFDFSQIPILAWGCLMVYRQTNDRELLQRALPYLMAFDQWWSTERDVDGDGLIECGAYAVCPEAVALGLDIVQCARYESFDFHSTLDHLKLTKHPKRKDSGEWYGNVEGVDLTCFLIMAERALAEIARDLGNKEVARKYEKVVARRVKAVQELMWNPKTQFFHSLERDTHQQLPDRTIQAFLTLTAGAATKEQAETLVQSLLDPKIFWCKYPVPTQAMDDPKYSPKGVWRGDVWPPMNYLVACGLNRYGYRKEARELTERTIRMIGPGTINERYDGTTGQPTGGWGLQMSCTVGLMIVQNVYGIQEDFRTICVPVGAQGRKLKWGALEVSYPADNVVELKTDFPREFRVVFPLAVKHATITCDGRRLAPAHVKVSKDTVTFPAQAARAYRVSGI